MSLVKQTLRKTVRAKIVNPTKTKAGKLAKEFEEFQKALYGRPAALYSATAQQAGRIRKKILRNGSRQIGEDHPLIIRTDLVKIERSRKTRTRWWARVPCHGGSIWVPVAVAKYQEGLLKERLREAKMVKRGGDWYLHIAVEKDVWVEIPGDPSRAAVIAVDIGEANLAASVALVRGRVTSSMILGRELRGIRTKYNRVRKLIGERKRRHALRVIKRMGNRESRIAEDACHKASRGIVEQAKALREKGFQVAIAVGDLKNVRRPRKKGQKRCRKNNRKVHAMPSHRLKGFIRYKALEEGIPVYFVNEAYTSRACHVCGSLNTLIEKRSFRCKDCGLEYNRDLNAAVNIANRSLGYILEDRGSCDAPEPPLCKEVQDGPARLLTPTVCDGGNLQTSFK
jgi:IS605 OrfB family transposase